MTHETQATVELRRSVRYGRLLIAGAIVGGAIASLASLFFPIEEGALYSMGQIMGFMLLIGGAIGLALGGILALILNLVAKRKHGTAVVAIAHESDIDANAEPTGTLAENLAEDIHENPAENRAEAAAENDEKQGA